jgi:hypothetical protein
MAKPLYETGFKLQARAEESWTILNYTGRTPSWGGGAPEGAGGGNPPLHERESCGVLPEVVWMSQASAEVYEPGEREVCISIRDPAAPLPGLSPRFIAVLSLEFQDDPEPGWEERGRSITEAQADQVIEFVERHVAARRIVVHCLVGVSRSPSLAAGLLVAHGRWAEPDRIVNPGVYQRILGACARRLGGAASLVSPPTAAAVTM